MKNHLIFRVSEVHVVKNDRAFQLRVGNGSFRFMRVFPCPEVGPGFGLRNLAVLILFCIDQFHVAIVCLRFLIHQVKDTLCAGCGVDHEVDLLTDLCDRVRKALI